jgi:[glutamine synthetase] adenylyltransferase / [glutamine synthetase]-adenylyl-L-tyrosine phosphorylase
MTTSHLISVESSMPFELSRYLQRLCVARPALREQALAALDTPLSRAELLGFVDASSLTDDTIKPALRRFKHQAYVRIATRDLSGKADLAEVTETMTSIAEIAIDTALAVHSKALSERYGVPRNQSGQEQQLIVIGMGKLGGRELNVSSDIDLIFAYPDDGDTDITQTGSRSISNFDFFTRLGRAIINSIGDITEDGQVFRVDMRLRPNGDSGPLVCSFDMLEQYFIAQGREWERYAWIKARPLTGTRHDELEAIRKPFIFRKYLDFGCINAMRELHAQIRREVAKKDMAANVKLGPGGIREIEFIAQVFQLIRGGREPQLQIKPTLQVLALLVEQGVLAADTVVATSTAYNLLRRVEHRLQYVDDAQTHVLPDSESDRALLAKSMNFECYDDLLAVLDGYRAHVTRQFEAVFAAPSSGDHPLALLWQNAGDDDLVDDYGTLGFRQPKIVAQRVAALHSCTRYVQMSTGIRERFDVLIPQVIAASVRTKNPDVTLVRSLDLLEAISRRASYLALLQQYPDALNKLVELLSASGWAATYLQSHPILLDELLDPRLLDVKPDWQEFSAQLQARLDESEPDTERQMDLMREMHHAQVFRLLVQDVAGLMTVEHLADHLSKLADILLDAAIDRVWRKLSIKHCDTPRFAIISYGKLGGKELGFASDLDLVFIYEDAHPDAAHIYGRFGTRLNTWLSAQTPAGQLFDTDLRLRPNGDSGLVVSTIEGFAQYQHESAWVWEHQALTRARFSAGDEAVGAAFERLRNEVLRRPRERETLRTEVIAMRQKMRDSLATQGDERESEFDIKHDPGGLVDVEFIVQYLILAHAHEHERLTGNLGNIALLGIAGELGLIPVDLADTVLSAYRNYRHRQHRARLNGDTALTHPDEIAPQAQAVRRLWDLVFTSPL